MAVEPVLQMQNIGKSYFGTQVLKDINIELKPGEVHGIVGENGAGKSTLMNILFGMRVIHSTGGFEGSVLVDGQQVVIDNPQMAMSLGIGMVHQEFMLLPNYTLTENIKLNRETLKPNILSRFLGNSMKSLDFSSMNNDARKALDRLNINIEEYVTVAGLPVGYMQFTEIAREIDKTNLKILVFDEPTAVLTESEADHLLKAIGDIADLNIAVLFITHRLHEIMEVCDTITVLRDGNHVVTKSKAKTDVAELAELMVGRRMDTIARSDRDLSQSNPILEVRDLEVQMPGERVRGVDLQVHEGEIFGIGGLAGQGKIGIANGIMGLFPTKGDIKIEGQDLELNSPKASMAGGLAYVSEDRRGVGLLLDSSIEDNIVFSAVQNQDRFMRSFGLFSQLDTEAIRKQALQFIKDLDIRCKGPEQPVKQLSGGNQQKVCVARALTMNPKILVVSEPTRGIDVGAKRLVLDTLRRLNKELKMTILMISSELGELRGICDRIAIVTDGKIAGILKPDDSDVNYGLLMSGHEVGKGA